MEFTNGTAVFTNDGRPAGNLRRVVIDPETKEITHIVIEKGWLLKEDKVINVEQVASTSVDKVNLLCTPESLKEMPPLIVKQYIPPAKYNDRGENYDPVWDKDTILTTTNSRTIREDLVALKGGARVVNDDGATLGTIERVMTDQETLRVSQFIISKGFLAKNRKSVPIDWVKFFDEDQIWLSEGNGNLEDLPLVG